MPAYNLELFGGRFHTDLWFALAWGAFPVAHGVRRRAGTVRARGRARGGLGDAALARAAAALDARAAAPPGGRRRRGELELADGAREALTRETLVAAPEAALRLLAAATVLLAAALVALRA